MILKEWLTKMKNDAKKMTDSQLMECIDILDKKAAKNSQQTKAIELMKKVYEYELQERLWKC